MKIEEVIDVTLKLQITFNQFFILYLVTKKDNDTLSTYISSNGQFTFEEIHDLIKRDLLINEIEGNVTSFTLSKLSTTSLFQKSLKSVLKQQIDISSWIDDWYELFPKGIKSGGYYVKTSKKGCEKKLKKFLLENPEYDSEIIIGATKLYIMEMESKGYDRMKLAPNFIEKDSVSMLSGYCEQYVSSDKSPTLNDWNVIKV